MNNDSPLQQLHLLSEYPALSQIAGAITCATKLDGRACKHLYLSSRDKLIWAALSDLEKGFIRALGISDDIFTRS